MTDTFRLHTEKMGYLYELCTAGRLHIFRKPTNTTCMDNGLVIWIYGDGSSIHETMAGAWWKFPSSSPSLASIRSIPYKYPLWWSQISPLRVLFWVWIIAIQFIGRYMINISKKEKGYFLVYEFIAWISYISLKISCNKRQHTFNPKVFTTTFYFFYICYGIMLQGSSNSRRYIILNPVGSIVFIYTITPHSLDYP